MEQYNLSCAEVLACLAYYDDHHEAIDAVMEAEDRALKQAAEPSSEWKARMHRRLQEMGLTLNGDATS